MADNVPSETLNAIKLLIVKPFCYEKILFLQKTLKYGYKHNSTCWETRKCY